MNLPTRQAESLRGDNNNGGGGGALRGTFDAAPAHPLTVGEIGFGPCWHDDEPTLRQMYERACQSIVRLECEADELRAEVVLLREEQAILRAKL